MHLKSIKNAQIFKNLEGEACFQCIYAAYYSQTCNSSHNILKVLKELDYTEVDFDGWQLFIGKEGTIWETTAVAISSSAVSNLSNNFIFSRFFLYRFLLLLSLGSFLSIRLKSIIKSNIRMAIMKAHISK